MTKEQIEQKAKNVYMRCFDDDFEYTGVLHALEICTEETATEATKELQKQIEIDAIHIRALQKQNGELTDKVKELEAQIEKMSEILLDLLWFEEHLDPYMYDCNDAQKGELLKPFDNARLFLEKYKCKKCKGEGIIKVGYNGWTTNPCPACEGKGYILRR
jgi:hypothetical protein